jgi:hypothetical protein
MSLPVSGDYYGAGAGVDSYASGGATKFIPEIWSGKLQVKFYENTVLAQITNNDWEGEIKDVGDKVQIRTVPDITINDYSKGMNLTNQVPTSTPISLSIDKGKYFAFVCDDVDALQSDVKLMDSFSQDAGEKMKIAIDSAVLNSSAIVTGIAATNKGATAGAKMGNINLGVAGTPVQVTAANVIDKIMDLAQVLDEANVPETGRFVVIPPWMARLLKVSDLKNAYLTGDGQSTLRSGKIGEIDRFTIYVSNSLTHATDGAHLLCVSILAGTKHGISFASQMTKMETLRSTTTFGNIVRGLNVYGFGVTKSTALARLYAKP